MDVIEFAPTPEQYGWSFGGTAPIRRVRPGSVLQLWSDDAFAGRLRDTKDRASALLDTRYTNPQTGPFFVEGAEPGDTLALHFVSIEPARDWGVSTTLPLFGGLTGTTRTATLQDPLPELTWVYEIDSAARTVTFNANESDHRILLPLEPMLGTVGVAPERGEVRSTAVPDTFGGNMDTPEMRAGATCYLGVNVEGALFSIGDGHARQGEGESCGVAVETAMNVTMIVDLIKGGAPAWPRIEDDRHLMTVGSGRPLDDAWRAAQVDMIGWLGGLLGMGKMDAYQLLTQISESPIANMVDPNFSAAVKVAKDLLPPMRAYGGMHQHLRELAAGL
ncbi:acetamidase/formamidase family protein [Pseudonocardia alaniniphila]|uniref:Acetamidase/formamidase family protein n=1 Tax=Pseudonocardia alaniniphila TaxID=75291 RepID=A0ABS9THQ3_9PSEU|nr:acetamidase/formamidase family protein [Pseudonocardia alaniniphila]MCH6168067.1 acetamidase/formamidase family protein [Pseudonocardia alaniniphila]